jgi:hypothetical protein
MNLKKKSGKKFQAKKTRTPLLPTKKLCKPRAGLMTVAMMGQREKSTVGNKGEN